jgi:RNA polymerase sigma-32 factor
MSKTNPSQPRSLEVYFSEINRFPLLTFSEEQDLARAYRQKGDTRAAHRLVTANLRFVVKVAYEYRSYGLAMAELVQEGNLGLMKAVEKFDPDKGIRLISYAVWWIRAYVQNHILKSFSLVKLGTTQAQRKLFFALARTRRELEKQQAVDGADSDAETCRKIATKLRVKPAEVAEMTQRMGGRDLSLDAPVGDDGGDRHVDFVAGTGPSQDDALAVAREEELVRSRIASALTRLDDRERFIVEHRLMTEEPMTLGELGAHFGFSRERARQLELRAKAKLKEELRALPAEIEWASAA